MEQLNITVVGAGLIGLSHLERIYQHPECRIGAIVDPSENAKAIAEQYKVPLFTTLAQLFENAQPDGIILATPNQLHVEQALECIKHNVPVLIEKPVSQSIEEGKVLLDEVKKTGNKVLVGHHRAYSSIMEKARNLIKSGAIGRPVAVMGSALFYKPDSYFLEGMWRTQKGGGPILLNLIHEIGNLRYLLGEVAAVQAMSSNTVRGHEVEDTSAITLQFENGVLGTFLLSDTAASARSWEQTSQENKAYSSYEDEDCYHIAGTEGSLSIPTMRIKRYLKTEDRSWWKPFDCSVETPRRDDPLVGQIDHFCRVIRGETEPRVSVQDGLQNLMVVDCIVKAAQTGARVQVAKIE